MRSCCAGDSYVEGLGRPSQCIVASRWYLLWYQSFMHLVHEFTEYAAIMQPEVGEGELSNHSD